MQATPVQPISSRPDTSGRSPESLNSSGPSLYMLLIEESRADAFAMLHHLQARLTCSRIRWLADGEEALEYIARAARRETRLPDVILLDLNLPRLSGLEVLMELKENAVSQGIPVAVLSTPSDSGDSVQSLALGAELHFSRPEACEYSELISQFINWAQARCRQAVAA